MTALEDGLEGSQIRGEKPPVSWSPVRWTQPVLAPTSLRGDHRCPQSPGRRGGPTFTPGPVGGQRPQGVMIRRGSGRWGGCAQTSQGGQARAN